jgi:hypothetical protein
LQLNDRHDSTVKALTEVLDKTTHAAGAINVVWLDDVLRRQQVSEIVWSSFKRVWDKKHSDGSFQAISGLLRDVHLKPVSEGLWDTVRTSCINSHLNTGLEITGEHRRASWYLAQAD